MCYARYAAAMESISHRELRNESGRVLRAVAAGESFLITNDGRAVARIVPSDAPDPSLRRARPAHLRGGFSQLGRARVDGDLAATLDDLRSDR